jgi:hypothetical protein
MVTLFVGIGFIRKKAVSLGPFKKSLARPPIVRDHAETASAISLKRRP